MSHRSNLRHNIVLIIFSSLLSFSALAAGIAIKTIKLTYYDDRTNPKKPVVRDFKGFSDNTIWSKPHKINAEIEITNKGTKDVKSIRFSGGLFVLLSDKIYGDKIGYPSINDPKHVELKDLSEKPVWAWNKSYSFDNKIKILQSGETKKIIIKDIEIWNQYNPFGYSISSYAIKIKAYGNFGRGKDKHPNDNFIDVIYFNGD